MRKFLKVIRMVILGVVLLVVLLALGSWAFVSFSPQFGGKPSTTDKERFAETGYYKEGIFVNSIPTSLDMSAGTMFSTMVAFIKGDKDRSPSFDLPVTHHDSTEVADYDGPTRLVWFGHSAFLLQMEGKNILIDPMFGESPSPLPVMGAKRYGDLPMAIEKIPAIDFMLISHDHYDHLDYHSIQKLKAKTQAFYVPLGVGAHFKAWGVKPAQIKEFEWWETLNISGLDLAFTPSRHFSGRGITDRNATLWGSWIIKSSTQNIYFSGDSGYGPHFKEIGERFGPFDFAMLECGQYNENWADIHMMPEQTAQAAVDLDTRVMMPIHWGAFTLALHSWDDPIKRVIDAAQKLDMPLIAPKIGEEINLSSRPMPLDFWWSHNS